MRWMAPLSNRLTIGKLPPLADGDLYNAVQAIFATGRAIAALVTVSVRSKPSLHVPVVLTTNLLSRTKHC